MASTPSLGRSGGLRSESFDRSKESKRAALRGAVSIWKKKPRTRGVSGRRGGGTHTQYQYIRQMTKDARRPPIPGSISVELWAFAIVARSNSSNPYIDTQTQAAGQQRRGSRTTEGTRTASLLHPSQASCWVVQCRHPRRKRAAANWPPMLLPPRPPPPPHHHAVTTSMAAAQGEEAAAMTGPPCKTASSSLPPRPGTGTGTAGAAGIMRAGQTGSRQQHR